MKRILVLVAILGLAGCAGNYETTFDHDASPEPITVHVVPVVTKEEMDVQIVVADSSAVSSQAARKISLARRCRSMLTTGHPPTA